MIDCPSLGCLKLATWPVRSAEIWTAAWDFCRARSWPARWRSAASLARFKVGQPSGRLDAILGAYGARAGSRSRANCFPDKWAPPTLCNSCDPAAQSQPASQPASQPTSPPELGPDQRRLASWRAVKPASDGRQKSVVRQTNESPAAQMDFLEPDW